MKPKAKITLVLLLSVALLAIFPGVDRAANSDYDSLFGRALVTFALARTLNGVISAVQGTEVALQPAGVGVTLTPGEILDPVNDLVERFSWVMLGATISLGVQQVLLDISNWWGVKVLVVSLVLLYSVFRLRGMKDSKATELVFRIMLLTLFVRFAVPLTLIANDALYKVFLEPRYQTSTEVIENAGKELESMGEEDPAVEEDVDRGFFGSITHALEQTADQINIKERLARMKERASDVIEHLIQLSVVFILQTGVLPIVFLWLLIQVLKRLLLSPLEKEKSQRLVVHQE